MEKLRLFLLLVLLILTNNVMPQNGGKLIGVVTDDNGQPLVGCSVYIENLMLGDATDLNGNFIILNIPPGNYNVKAQMLGYKSQIVEGVKIQSGLTTTLDFKLSSEAITLQEVQVTSFKNPPVQKDLTNKIQARTGEEISQIPITTVKDILIQQAGITANIITQPVSSMPVFGQFATIPSDGLHFRGGRENEVSYLFDGIDVRDALWGDFNLEEMGELLISSLETFTGTFGPQYGEAMSGVVKVSTLGNLSTKPKIAFKAFTDKLGISSNSENTYSYEFVISSALPFYKDLAFVYSHRTFSTDGYIYGYIYPNYVNSEGLDLSGTPEKVPMQYKDTNFDFVKLLWEASRNLKVTLGGFISKANKGLYNHYFKYNPYGTPRVRLNDNLAYVKFNYLISENSYVGIALANYERAFKSRVYDNIAFYDIVPQTGTAEFSISGEDYVYFDTYFNRKEASVDFVWQINETHNLSVGSEFKNLKTNLARKNPDGGKSLEEYSYRPYQLSGYVSEKMEFTDMGMIINLGLRYDYLNPNREVLKDIKQLSDITAPLVKSKSEFYVTPRLGISFPIADKAAIRFGYGHYFQYPHYYKVYQGTYLLQATGQYRPNPQLANTPISDTEIKPEKTVNYEFGLQTLLSSDVSLDLTAFYRKTSNLIGVILNETYDGKRFLTMGNIDYATVKGIEISLKKQFSNNFSAFLNYTLSSTLVSTSVLFERRTDESRTFPANWDQPHVFQGNIHFEMENGFGFSLYGSLASGFPYTRSSFDPNGERSPAIHQLDLNLFKNLKLLGFNQQIFVQIMNLTNDRNIWWVYADSGVPGVDANPATSYDYTNNPSMYGPGRTIRLGIKLWN
ncbi:MAG: TonB-dependent receptor [Ignavibacterium sp.]|uniref:TonB-dependent receptor n=1 Tax=Ignavibacterium sp. TaxID=2651167 RepID=UPI0040499953